MPQSAAQLEATAAPDGDSARPRRTLRAATDLVDLCLHPGDSELADRVALVTRAGGAWTQLTYGELDRRSTAVAGWLRARAVVPSDRVALTGEGSGDWVTSLFGILRAGAIAVPLDPKLTADELAPVMEHAMPTALAVSSDRAEAAGAACRRLGARPPILRLEDLAGLPDPRPPVIGPAPSPHTPAVIAWTSGTTSAAKGVALSAAGISYVVSALVRAQGLHADDRLLSVLPPHHMLELSCSLLSALAAGATVTFAGTLMPNEILDAVAERRITKLVAVPLLADLLKRRLEAGATVAAASATSLEAVYCGGAPLDPRIIDFYAGLGIPVYQGYGLTETAPTIAMNTPAQNRPGSVGRPLPGTEVRITAPSAEGDGEILVRSPAVMLGYWRDEALTASVVDADGWLHTGDLGRVDSDGFLWITGRAKNVIVLDSGKKVHPEEVEAALAASDAIAEACVLGWRPPGSGLVGAEQVCAVVVASKPHAASHRGDARDAIEDEVRRRTAGLSGYKRPSMTRVVAGPLPRSAKGAVRLSAVRALLDQQERMR